MIESKEYWMNVLSFKFHDSFLSFKLNVKVSFFFFNSCSFDSFSFLFSFEEGCNLGNFLLDQWIREFHFKFFPKEGFHSLYSIDRVAKVYLLVEGSHKGIQKFFLEFLSSLQDVRLHSMVDLHGSIFASSRSWHMNFFYFWADT